MTKQESGQLHRVGSMRLMAQTLIGISGNATHPNSFSSIRYQRLRYGTSIVCPELRRFRINNSRRARNGRLITNVSSLAI